MKRHSTSYVRKLLTESKMSYKYIWVVLVAQLCLTLCDPKDCTPPGSSVHGIVQARILEWIAIIFILEWLNSKTLHHYMLVRMWSNKELLFIAGGNAQWCSHFGRQIGSFFTVSPYDWEITVLGNYPYELKSYVYTKTCIWMFMWALLVIARTCKLWDVFQ